MNNFYVYGYTRSKSSETAQENTFYYIGKGCGNRAYKSHNKIKVPEDDTHIIMIAENLSESRAFEIEKELIRKYGRKDIGTGILLNRTDGGEGQSGRKMSVETKRKLSESKRGKKLGAQSEIQKSQIDHTSSVLTRALFSQIQTMCAIG